MKGKREIKEGEIIKEIEKEKGKESERQRGKREQ